MKKSISIIEKMNILKKPVWKKSDVNLYFDFELSDWQLRKIFKSITNKPVFDKNFVFRDEVLGQLGTSVDTEFKNLKSIIEIQNINEGTNNHRKYQVEKKEFEYEINKSQYKRI